MPTMQAQILVAGRYPKCEGIGQQTEIHRCREVKVLHAGHPFYPRCPSDK